MDRRALRPSVCALLLVALLALGCATPKPPRWSPLSDAAVDHPLSLEECLALALRSDVQTETWKAKIAVARAELTTARELPNPTFEATWEDVGLKDPATGESLMSKTKGLSYPVFFWWTRDREVAAARAALRVEEQGVRAEQRDLILEVGAAYCNLAAAARKIRISEGLLANAQESLRLADETFRIGSASGHDLNLAKTETAQAEAELFDAQNEERIQSLAFAFALGADHPLRIRIRESDVNWTIPVADEDTSASLPAPLAALALEFDPAYAKARAARQAAEASLQLERRKMIPLADAEASAANRKDPSALGKTTHNYGFTVPIPLFNWNLGGVRKAKAELLAAQTDEEKARREALSRLSDAWESYRFARERYRRFSQPIVESRARLTKDAEELFGAGQIDYQEFLQTRGEWQQAELAAVDFWRDSMTAAFRLLAETGKYDRAASSP
ncbi:MAG: TolC family protein [Candidatus Sumerlaeota bacterium]|nr:TolC family protein [Candidatus Sumerlaeota bacterium]